MSLVYWKHTPKLACHPKPDVRYAVNMTVAALHEEFSAPGLSTISAALIDLTGRPIFSMTGNAVSCGRMLSLANCLGLNRDPSLWKLSQQEKDQRIRLWWGVVIHDRWYDIMHSNYHLGYHVLIHFTGEVSVTVSRLRLRSLNMMYLCLLSIVWYLPMLAVQSAYVQLVAILLSAD